MILTKKLLVLLPLLIHLKLYVAEAPNYRVTIVTSVYRGDEFIEQFMEDITRQTIYDQCEHIIINAASPGNEEPIIKKYMQEHPNIVYKKLTKDPGIYGVWNMAIRMSHAPYITNANLDDRLHPDCYRIHADALDKQPNIDVVYSGSYVTYYPNETFENNQSGGRIVSQSQKPFNALTMYNRLCCYPNNNPMWRKSLHSRYGLFNEEYLSAGDLEFWMRIGLRGYAQFKMIKGNYGLYYNNPYGMSSSHNSPGRLENELIKKTYKPWHKKRLQEIQVIQKSRTRRR